MIVKASRTFAQPSFQALQAARSLPSLLLTLQPDDGLGRDAAAPPRAADQGRGRGGRGPRRGGGRRRGQRQQEAGPEQHGNCLVKYFKNKMTLKVRNND